MRISYEQARSDYEYLEKKYGSPYDLTGGFVIDEKCFILLRNPSKKSASELYVSLIQYGINDGFDGCDGDRGHIKLQDIEDDNRVTEILERY